MTDRPIPFTEPMVRALLEGRKTQTRRLPRTKDSVTHGPSIFGDNWADSFVLDDGNREWRERCYPWRVCDRLWVREPWRAHSTFDAEKGAPPAGTKVFYIADQKYEPQSRYRHARFMPRWASRLMLFVTDVRVQRVQEISEADAKAEGALRMVMDDEAKFYESERGTFRVGFAGIWAHIHGAAAWNCNPFVVAITFEVHKANIDSLRPALSD